MTFSQAAAAYVAAPSPGTLAALHHWIQIDVTYDPAIEFRSRVVPMLEAGDHRGAVATLQQPGLFLSPSAHSLLARAHLAAGDMNRAEQHRNLASISLVAIRDSGDGSAVSPWQVLRLADQHDALALWGLRSVSQTATGSGGRTVDAHTCEDATVAHFVVVDRTRTPEGAPA